MRKLTHSNRYLIIILSILLIILCFLAFQVNNLAPLPATSTGPRNTGSGWVPAF